MNIIETSLKFKNSMTNRSATKRIILHHAEASQCTAEDIHRWHLNNGWAGAGYHFLVRKDGSIYRLRPENKVGAHAQGANSDSIGICFEGAYMAETMPQAQINAGKELVAYLKINTASARYRHTEMYVRLAVQERTSRSIRSQEQLQQVYQLIPPQQQVRQQNRQRLLETTGYADCRKNAMLRGFPGRLLMAFQERTLLPVVQPAEEEQEEISQD